MIALPDEHNFVYYTDEPKAMYAKCPNQQKPIGFPVNLDPSTKFHAGYINSDKGCSIFAKDQFLITSSEQKVTLSKANIFYHPVKMIKYNSTINDDELVALNNYVDEPETSVYDDVQRAIDSFPVPFYANPTHLSIGYIVLLVLLIFSLFALYCFIKKRTTSNANVTLELPVRRPLVPSHEILNLD